MPRLPIRSLVAKLALFYGALGLVALLLVKSTVLWLELRELDGALAHGALAYAVEDVAAELSESWAPDSRAPAFSLDHAIESVQVRLERGKTAPGGEGGNVLGEVAAQPLAARIVDVAGTALAVAPLDAAWNAPALPPSAPFWTLARSGRRAQLIASDDPPALRRVYAAPLHDRAGTLRGALVVELRLALPWRRVLFSGSFEWPMLLAYLLVFGVGSALFLSRFVTARLRRIGAAASAWSRGDFSAPIADASRDEIGELARKLDRMAADLRALVQTRGQLATLEERQRLARDLHDTVKQKAFALNLQLATATRLLGADAPAVRAKLEEGRRITEEIQAELVQILDEIRAAERAPPPLPVLLAQKADDLARRGGLAIEADLAAAAQVPAAQHEAVARIVDEALANVMRHSGARRVRLALTREDGEFTLAIEDDGRGPSAGGGDGSGMGVRNMRARAATLPFGRFALDGDGGGTRVTVCWRAAETPEHEANDR